MDTSQKRALAALLLALGFLAVVCVVTDSESVVRAEVSRDADREIPLEASLLAESQSDALSEGDDTGDDDKTAEAAAQWSSIDDAGAWAKAAAEAASVSQDAVKLKQQSTKREQAKKRKQQVKKKMAKVQAVNQHIEHKSLRNAAAKVTTVAVRQQMSHVMGGLSSLASKAAAKAAKKVMQADKRKTLEAQIAQAAAMRHESQLQHLVDSIAVYKDKIHAIQGQAKKDKDKADSDTADFAHKVEQSVGAAKLHFQRMRSLLLEYQTSKQKEKQEKASIKEMTATAALLRKHIAHNKKAVQKVRSQNAQEHRAKRFARHKFQKKTRRVQREMERLQGHIRETIEAEVARKNRPSVTGQLTYEQMNRKNQRNHIRLARLSTKLRQKTRELRSAQRKEAQTAKLAAKRAAVLKVARVAYHNLRFAAHTLRKVVQKKKTAADVKPKPKATAGTAFTQKLLDQVTSSVKAAAHSAAKHEVAHLKKHIKQKADDA